MSQPTPQPQDTAEQHHDTPQLIRERRLSTLERALGIGVASLAIISGVLGLFARDQVQQADTAVDRAQSVSQDLDQAQQEAAAAEASAETLREQNNTLKGQLETAIKERDAARDALPSDTPVPDADTPGVYHSGSLTVAKDGDSIGFDSPPSSKTWQGGSGGGFIDYQSSRGLRFAYLSSMPIEAANASYDFCSAQTAYEQTYRNTPIEDTYYCLRSNTGRFGVLHLTSVSESRLSFDLTTWETPL